jgi:hypothetical protein
MDIYKTINIDKNTENHGKRKERSKTFDFPDDTFRVLCFTAPIHYWTDVGQGENPEIAEFDDINICLQLVSSDTKDFNSYISLKNKFTVGFRDDGNPEKYIGIRNLKGDQFECTLLNVELETTDINDIKTHKKTIIDKNYNTIEKISDYSFKHSTSDFDIITDLNEMRTRTAVKVTNQISNFKILEKINLTGITILNEKINDEYIVSKDNKFNFLTSDGQTVWIPTPCMWTDTQKSNHITHRLYEQDGNIIYEKTPTSDGIKWLLLAGNDVYIDATIYYSPSSDGYTSSHGSTQYGWTWASVHNNTGTNFTANQISTTVNAQCGKSYDGTYYQWYMDRGFFFFDTSGIEDTITSASLNLYCGSSNDSSISVQKSTVVSDSVLAKEDAIKYTGSYYSVKNWTAGWNAMTFNATGISDIIKTGVTKLCCREYNYDYLYVEPATGTGSYNYYATSEDATNKPYLDLGGVNYKAQIIMF